CPRRWDPTSSSISAATCARGGRGRGELDGRLASAVRPCCCATRAPRPAASNVGVGPRMDEEKLLPIYGEVARRAGEERWLRKEKLLPIYGEVARRAGGAEAC